MYNNPFSTIYQHFRPYEAIYSNSQNRFFSNIHIRSLPQGLETLKIAWLGKNRFFQDFSDFPKKKKVLKYAQAVVGMSRSGESLTSTPPNKILEKQSEHSWANVEHLHSSLFALPFAGTLYLMKRNKRNRNHKRNCPLERVNLICSHMALHCPLERVMSIGASLRCPLERVTSSILLVTLSIGACNIQPFRNDLHYYPLDRFHPFLLLRFIN